jgi:hypothetical protein
VQPVFAFPELRVGGPLRHASLTVFPLFADRPAAGDYTLSDVALADGTAVVEEVTESGSVPQLSVTVTADRPLLFLEGEELRGAKQNRVLNTSVLVAANRKSVLPVSCVEQGRWRHVSRTFGHAGTHASPKLRKVLKESVTQSTLSGGGHRSNQSAVWSEVGRQMCSLGSASDTMAMADTYESYRSSLADYQANLTYPDGAVGMAAAVGGVVVSVDVFDSPETCQRVWPRVLTGLAMDALEATPAAADPDVSAVLDAFRSAAWQPVPAAGVGEEYRTAHGSALAQGGRLVHGSMVFDPAPVGA